MALNYGFLMSSCIVTEGARWGKCLLQINVTKVIVRVTNIIRGDNRAFWLKMLLIWGFVTQLQSSLVKRRKRQRFVVLWKIPIFLKYEGNSDTTIRWNQLVDAQILACLAFVTDMISHFNELNLKLQIAINFFNSL